MKTNLYSLGYLGMDGVFHVKRTGSKEYVNKEYSKQKPLKKSRRWEIIEDKLYKE